MKIESVTLKHLFPSTSTIKNISDQLKDSFLAKSKISWNVLVLASTFLLLIGSAVMVYVLQKDFELLNLERQSTTLGYGLLMFAMVLLLVKIAFFAYSIVLHLRYKPIKSVSDAMLPTCTVIVPAFNEGKQVYATLMSLGTSDFPESKLQLLAIDDGSVDDTWHWIQEAKKELGDRVSIFQQPKNMGKRHALYRGFNLGNGEIFVTVDSDSVVKPDTLRNLVSPFVVNKNYGAVAGNIRVLNKKKSILPKMLNVSFVLSFEFVRSAQSTLNSVLCTPGALAAYRRSSVFEVLPEWINQTFMGQPSDIGEDRAMTNMILKKGHHVFFQRNAYCYTNVPEHYKGLYKMFIRWGRSNVRENLNMANYVFTNFREGSKLGTRLLFIEQALTMVLCYPFIFLMFFFIAMHPILFLSSTLFSILILSSFPMLFYAQRYSISESFWAYSYSILYAFGLFWITPYAIATANKSGWLTRAIPEKNTAS